MPADRGINNRASRPMLSSQQVEELVAILKKRNRQANCCKKCNKMTTFHKKGHSTQDPSQPVYKCAVCSHTISAYDLYTELQKSSDNTPETSVPDEAIQLTTPLAASETATMHSDTSAIIRQLQLTVESLTAELTKAREEISLLKLQIHSENTQTQPQDPLFDDIILEDETPAPVTQDISETPANTHPWHNSQRITRMTQSLYTEQQRIKRRQQKQEAAARFLQKPSTNQGFTYIYIPTKARIPVGKLRTTFRRLGIPNGRLLDIHYPSRNLAAILVHNDYASELKSTLQQRGVTVDETYDPTDGATILDPKYQDYTQFQRDQIASFIHKRRLETALQHIREPVKFAVARYFYQQQWISKSAFDHTMAARSSLPTDVFIMESSQPTPTKPRPTYNFEFDADDNLIPPLTQTDYTDTAMIDSQ